MCPVFFIFMFFVFFFFKQKTAYEVRISDWSSDVCSSDLQAVGELRASARQGRRWVLSCEPTLLMRWLIPRWPDFQARHPGIDVHLVAGGGPFSFANGIDLAIRRDDFPWPDGRSEEHTSELQSLMRISYAVFCLKKKKN